MDLSSKKRKGEENGGIDAGAPPSKLTPADARKIIESFSREQLLDIVQEAACRHADVLGAVRANADHGLAQRKLFIRGLGWDTTAEGLRSLFSAYGELEEAVVIMDKNTGKSKGYGFIIFRHIDGALLALKEPSKKIDGRMTVSQLAASGAAGPTAAQPSAADVPLRKIYVGSVPHDMPTERLLAHFSSYGEIEEGPLGFDKQTGKSRGFALFVYKTVDGAKASLVDPTKVIDGHTMVCKLAADGKKGKPGQPSDPIPAGPVGGVQKQHALGVGKNDAAATDEEKDDQADAPARSKIDVDLPSQFLQLLQSCSEAGNHLAFTDYLKGLSPSTLDVELRMLQIIDDEDIQRPEERAELHAIALLLDYFIDEISSKNSFEFIQAVMRLFLKIHGETVRRHPALQAKAKALLELQSSVWRRVDNMFQNTRCLVTFLSNLQF